jgi:hypothetical protein
MEALRIIEARIAKWMAYSDYCMNSDFGVPHCRTFWVWAGVVAALAAVGLAVYVARQFRANVIHEARKGDGGQQGN